MFHRQGALLKSWRRAWLSACKRAGLDRIPHDFRRTAVRNLERAGVPRSVAMQLVGHKTESIYRRYAIVAEADLRDGAAKLAAFMKNQDEKRNRDNPPHAHTSDGFADTGAISWCANELRWNGQGQN